jgi:hypothetical protein
LVELKMLLLFLVILPVARVDAVVVVFKYLEYLETKDCNTTIQITFSLQHRSVHIGLIYGALSNYWGAVHVVKDATSFCILIPTQ